MITQPLLSVITVCYNCEAEIEATIKTVVKLINANIEYLIIDGASTDETSSIIDLYRDQISKVISEPDEGIYDAMNKGIANAKGKYICFINSGDELLQIPWDDILNNEGVDLLAFPVFIRNRGKLNPQNGVLMNYVNTLPHQGCFYRKTTFLKYNTQYKIFSDYDFNIKLRKSSGKIKVFKSPIVAMHSTNGVSNSKKSIGEFFDVVRANYGIIGVLRSWVYLKIRGIISRVKRTICF